MAYEVTASRKRPQKLDELAGQEFVAATLRSSIEKERIAHAYLFSGPRGVGKTSSARILAISLNCHSGPTADPCGTCANCLEIAQGNSLDVIEIDGASNTGVNDIREIKDEVLFAPSNSKYKIYIIDEVHMLSNSAFNALLKTIEEPPPYIVFIFATTEIHKVPATIKSRCQQFYFRLFSIETIKNLLIEISNETSIKYDDDALLWIAKEATGSLRDAYTLYDQVVSFSEGELTISKIREKLGIVGLDQLNELVEYMAIGDASNVLETGERLLNAGISIEQLVIDLAEYLRNILFIKHDIKKESLLGYNADRFSSKVISSFSVKQLEFGVEQTFQLYRDLRYSLNQRFELDILFSKLSSLSEYISSDSLVEKISLIRKELLSGNISESISVSKENNSRDDIVDKEIANQFFNKFRNSKELLHKDEKKVQSKGEPNKDISLDDIKVILLKHLKSANMSLFAALNKAKKWEIEGNVFKLTFNSLFESSFVQRESTFIIDEIKKLFKIDVRIDIFSDLEEVLDKNSIKKDPQIELVKSIFRGQLIKG